MTDELLNERYALAIERIRQIPAEKSVPQPYRDFFAQMAQYLCKMDQIRSRIAEGYLKTASEEELAVFNREPYEDVIGERYETSYGNPAFAVRALGETHGRSFCDSAPDLVHFAEVLCHLCKKIAVRLRNAFFRRNLADPLNCKRIPLV